MKKDNKNSPKKKIYFVSDCHFGIPDYKTSLKREKLFIQWLDEIKADAREIYFMGDLFDFWFEYKTVIPKGYTRLFGKLTEIIDSGIPVHLFRGNHDIWAFDYLRKELNINIHRKPLIKDFNNKRFFLAHGDGLGKGDKGYKFLKKIFESQLNQWLFKWIHPDIGTRIALYWSKRSRYANINKVEKTNGMEKGIKRLSNYCKEILIKEKHIDYFIMGHIHLPVITNITEKSKYISLGDWLTNFSYAVFDGNNVELKFYKKYLSP
ncbi:MAG: UDP-2,3-diacylglucosamine diphosphatase [Bacteroidales bacterium]|nr:UDP-2,3-diacylglucosamine diphosphatase [Bacteroidales bacterium]